MSEEPTRRIPVDGQLFEHYCEEPGCKTWGSLGYDVGKGEIRWYCFEHKWEEYPRPKGGTTF